MHKAIATKTNIVLDQTWMVIKILCIILL